MVKSYVNKPEGDIGNTESVIQAMVMALDCFCLLSGFFHFTEVLV